MDKPQYIGAGISREWHNDGQVVAYAVKTISASTLEAWSKDILAVLEDWPKNRPFCVLYDVSEHGVGIPYLALTRGNIFNIAILRGGEARVKEILAAHPAFRIQLALVVSDSFLGTYMISKGKTTTANSSSVEHKFFFSSNAALEWLTEAALAGAVDSGYEVGDAVS